MSVVSKTIESNAVSTYFVSCLAGPRLGKRRVEIGDAVEMSEHQARALLLSGELVADKERIDDPWNDAARVNAAQAEADKAAADTKAAADKAAADAKSVADKAATDAKAAIPDKTASGKAGLSGAGASAVSTAT